MRWCSGSGGLTNVLGNRCRLHRARQDRRRPLWGPKPQPPPPRSCGGARERWGKGARGQLKGAEDKAANEAPQLQHLLVSHSGAADARRPRLPSNQVPDIYQVPSDRLLARES